MRHQDPRITTEVYGQGAELAAKTRQRPSVAPTPADLQVLWGGRDRLLKIAKVAEHLGVCNATVYRLRDSGELPRAWIVNSIRIRPDDLEAFPGNADRGARRALSARRSTHPARALRTSLRWTLILIMMSRMD